MKLGQIIDILIDNDVKVIALVMRRDIALGKGLRHFEGTVGKVYE